MNRRFEWDPNKALSNLRKHGIDFETATVVFEDPFALVDLERIEDGEERWHILGMGSGSPLLLVVHTIRNEDEDMEIIRIISARRAERIERRRYEQQAS